MATQRVGNGECESGDIHTVYRRRPQWQTDLSN
jgi:hypothetical protein